MIVVGQSHEAGVVGREETIPSTAWVTKVTEYASNYIENSCLATFPGKF
jgi:hypothetical protein